MSKRKAAITHDPVVPLFADRLREVRRSRGMTQRDLARLAHLTESYISRLESATIAPGIDLVAQLCRALGITLPEILPGEPTADAFAVLERQAIRLLDVVLQSRDCSLLLQLNPFLAFLAESAERGR